MTCVYKDKDLIPQLKNVTEHNTKTSQKIKRDLGMNLKKDAKYLHMQKKSLLKVI